MSLAFIIDREVVCLQVSNLSQAKPKLCLRIIRHLESRICCDCLPHFPVVSCFYDMILVSAAFREFNSMILKSYSTMDETKLRVSIFGAAKAQNSILI